MSTGFNEKGKQMGVVTSRDLTNFNISFNINFKTSYKFFIKFKQLSLLYIYIYIFINFNQLETIVF